MADGVAHPAEVSSSVAAQLGGGLVKAHAADVGAARERARIRRLRALALGLSAPMAFLWLRILDGRPVNLLQAPRLTEDAAIWILPIVITLAVGMAVAMPFLSGRSPHIRYAPDQIATSFADVVGMDEVVGEVTRTLNTFMGHELYRSRLGGTPRRGVLFEGPPGTGKTHIAKAMAHEAGVPFLFVSATSFQSMYYGATARKIRSYFAALRKAARQDGGAIGFIEEIDAIALARGGMRSGAQPVAAATALTSGCLHAAVDAFGVDGGVETSAFGSTDGASGVVNELLVQLQSFDTPPTGLRIRNWLAEKANAFLPSHRQIKAKASPYHNILVIAATNRAADLDPALLRPGRFDKQLSFQPPSKPQRRALLDHFLGRKAHAADLDTEEARDLLAGQTIGYTPVMIENLLDEALVGALRHGRDGMTAGDVQQARLDIEVGLATPAPYTDAERVRVATHEAGHAVMAHLSGHRRLEVLSIIKRRSALGLLAHGDAEEVFTRTRTQMYDMVDIAMGGKAAEELWFGAASTGPGSDLAAATKTACEIVGVHGMADSLVSLAAVQQSQLSGTNVVGRVLSDPVARPQVDRLLEASLRRTTAALDANRHLVEALRDALLAREELVGEQILEVLRAAGPAVEDLRVEVDAPA
jgi:cell division protease FtsH